MGRTDNNGEEYGGSELDDRGRLTIPKELRDELHLEVGTTFTVVRDGGDIRLVRQLTELKTLSSNRSQEDWIGDAFWDAGEVTFGGR